MKRKKQIEVRYNQMNNLLKEFTIYAPQDGMVIYAKGGFGGERITDFVWYRKLPTPGPLQRGRKFQT